MRLSEQGAPVQVEDNIAADEFIAAAPEQRIVAFGMGATVTVILFNDGCSSCLPC